MLDLIINENAFGCAKKVQLSEVTEGIELSHKNFTAKLSLFGGHVLAWQPTNEAPVFWLSDKADYTGKLAIRGGIPLCWPWFGPLEKGELKANHGVARGAYWQLADVIIDELTITVTLTLTGKNAHPLWPHAFELKQELVFGQHFEQRLHITNVNEIPVEFTAALHSYFRVSSPSNSHVPVLQDALFDNTVTGEKDQQQTLVNCEGRIDRIYHLDQAATLVDTGYKRAIEISAENTGEWVLWNPGQALAETMHDIHAGGHNEYVCLEAAKTLWQVIPAGATATVGQVIRLHALD